MNRIKTMSALFVLSIFGFSLAGCPEPSIEQETTVATTPTVPSYPESDFLRLGQGTKGVWLSATEPYDPEWLGDWTSVWKDHLDVLEVLVQSDWHYRNWDFSDPTLPVEERASWQSKRLVDRTNEWIDALHEDGLLAAVSIGYSGTQVGVSGTEMMNLPQSHFATEYYGWTFDLETGSRVQGKGFDWCNPAGIEYARKAYEDISRLLGPRVDFLMLNELVMTKVAMEGWWAAPYYSDSALNHFRSYVNDPGATFPFDESVLPEGVELQEPELFNTTATQEQWDQWYDWLAENYRTRIATQAKGFAQGQADNPDFRGVIWFQNYNWVGKEWGIDLEKICSIPEVTYVVCENLDTPTMQNQTWAYWKASADAHQKKLGAFLNLSFSSPGYQGHYNTGITVQEVNQTLEYAIGEGNVPMMAMYWAGTFHPDPDISDGTYREDLVEVWDFWTQQE